MQDASVCPASTLHTPIAARLPSALTALRRNKASQGVYTEEVAVSILPSEEYTGSEQAAYPVFRLEPDIRHLPDTAVILPSAGSPPQLKNEMSLYSPSEVTVASASPKDTVTVPSIYTVISVFETPPLMLSGIIAVPDSRR